MAKPTPSLTQQKSGWIVPLLWAMAIAVVAMGLKLSPQWSAINGSFFDQASTTAPASPEERGIVIIAIDDPSFGVIDRQWPWPRQMHGELIEAVRAAGATAIGFDIVFSNPSQFGPEDDQYLANAAKQDTVFATDLVRVETAQTTSYIRNEPLAIFLENGARTGRANVQPDGDGVIRKLPSPDDNFMQELLLAAGEKPAENLPGDRLIQYFGPHNSYPRVSYYQALDPEEFLPPGFFKDKVVLVGYSLQSDPDVSTADAFETPYTARTGFFTAGVEVQATIYDNFKHGLAILNPPRWVGFMLLGLGSFLGFLVARLNKPLIRLFLTFGLVVLFLILGWISLRYGRIWLSPFDIGSGFLAVTGTLAARDFALERKMRSEIQGAFSQYLSPDMVNKIIADPSQLNLGGERRVMTIMFADIRGFTGLSESFKEDPQGLTQLINDILTPLADVVMANGGTIDKFIGDCIMAFWNAPLDDPDHAQNAVRTAKQMVVTLKQINKDLSKQLSALENKEIRIGIGLNTGDCVVGNMGSKSRFDYSVLGDTVNVAARLEELSKNYQANIVFGEDTFQALTDQSVAIELDAVQVRGREQALKIYTLKDE